MSHCSVNTGEENIKVLTHMVPEHPLSNGHEVLGCLQAGCCTVLVLTFSSNLGCMDRAEMRAAPCSVYCHMP